MSLINSLFQAVKEVNKLIFLTYLTSLKCFRMGKINPELGDNDQNDLQRSSGEKSISFRYISKKQQRAQEGTCEISLQERDHLSVLNKT